MSERLVELLREKAKEYELRALAAEERGQLDLSMQWSGISITLYEFASAAEQAEELAA